MTLPQEISTKFIRTCQECGHRQVDKDPQSNPTDAYRNRLCRRCKSEALDYGSPQLVDEHLNLVEWDYTEEA